MSLMNTSENCDDCGIHRNNMNDIPWFNPPSGILCKPCHAKRHEKKKHAAIAKAIENDHDEHDCAYTSEIICPVCASVISNDDIHESREMECDVCDAVFDMEIEWSPSYTTTLKQKG